MEHLYQYASDCCGDTYDYAVQSLYDIAQHEYALPYALLGTLVLYTLMILASNTCRIDALESQLHSLRRSVWKKKTVLQSIEDKIDDLCDFVRNRVVLKRDHHEKEEEEEEEQEQEDDVKSVQKEKEQ